MMKTSTTETNWKALCLMSSSHKYLSVTSRKARYNNWRTVTPRQTQLRYCSDPTLIHFRTRIALTLFPKSVVEKPLLLLSFMYICRLHVFLISIYGSFFLSFTLSPTKTGLAAPRKFLHTIVFPMLATHLKTAMLGRHSQIQLPFHKMRWPLKILLTLTPNFPTML